MFVGKGQKFATKNVLRIIHSKRKRDCEFDNLLELIVMVVRNSTRMNAGVGSVRINLINDPIKLNANKVHSKQTAHENAKTFFTFNVNYMK